MSDKLSREKWLKRWVKECSYNHDCHDCKDGGECATVYLQIKSLLTPVPEEEKVKIIQKYSAEIMTCASYMRAMGLMRQALKAYDNLCEGKEG